MEQDPQAFACPQCGELNEPGHRTCSRCSLPFPFPTIVDPFALELPPTKPISDRTIFVAIGCSVLLVLGILPVLFVLWATSGRAGDPQQIEDAIRKVTVAPGHQGGGKPYSEKGAWMKSHRLGPVR